MHYKKPRLQYYVQSLFNIFVWRFFPYKIESKLVKMSAEQKEKILTRLDYYIKLDNISLDEIATSISSLKREGNIVYYLDLKQYLSGFNKDFRFNYCFGDVTHIPETPSFLKSRPVWGDNRNSVILPLDSIRHFNFVEDKMDFLEKKDLVVWRGSAKQAHRQEFLFQYFDHPLCDIGSVKGFANKDLTKNFMTIDEQLKFKFILSLEGFDVATSLKWIMSSNSIAVMPEPKYETWFMEGTLVPDFHYIKIKDDYSDFEEKINFYIANPDKCLEIIKNANKYVDGFRDLDTERLLTMMVIDKYFSLSQQL